MTVNEKLGKYRILEELGKGGFATVYRALDITLDREVALKVLDPLLMRDETWVGHFRQEAKTVAVLKHPHIIGIYEINEVDDRLYIAMELAGGGSLAHRLATRGRILWQETLRLLRPVCEALEYAHDRGIVHRDLKPANVLLDPEDGPMLTDFGFARLLMDNSMSVSLSGGILGTPAYIAPEVWEYDRAKVPADVYALGCITYEMLTGRPLFGGKTPMQVVRAHDKGPQFPESWPKDVPGNIQSVLDKSLARDPEKRYASAEAFWYALHDLDAQDKAWREAARRAAVAAQWRAEAETAFKAQEWSTAKIAVKRWLAVAPEDEAARALQARITSASSASKKPTRKAPAAPTPSSSQPSSVPAWPPRPKSPSPRSAPQHQVQSGAPAPRKWVLVVAIIGLISGLVSCGGSIIVFPTLLSFPALILGLLALVKAERARNPRAVRILSLLALVSGLLGLLSVCIFGIFGTGLFEEILYELGL